MPAADAAASARQRHALTHLTRLARRRPQEAELLRRALRGRLERLALEAVEVAVETGDPMGKALLEALREEGTVALADQLHDRIPGETTALRELALEVTRIVLDQQLRAQPDAERSIALLHNYAQRLIMLGRVEQAQEVAQQTHRMLERRATDGHPDPRLSISLARVYADAGDYRQASAVLNAALAPLRQRSRGGDDEALSDLSFALHNLAAAHSELSLHEAAREAIEEAVLIRRRLYRAGRSAEKPQLANSLLVAGAIASDQGQQEKALQLTDQAIELLEGLAEREPDAHRPSLASALQNRASTLYDLGDYCASAQVAAQAVRILSGLAATHPQAFGPVLISTLRSVVNANTALRDWNTALVAATDAEAIARQLQPASHVTRREALAEALAAKGAVLHGLKRRDEAADVLGECLDIRRGLANEDPARYRLDLVRALNNYANGVGWNADDLQALAAAREAIALLQGVPRRHRPPADATLAAALDTLGCRLAALLRHRAALRRTTDACLALAVPFKRLPDRYVDWMKTFFGHVETLVARVPRRAAALTLASIRYRLARPTFHNALTGARANTDPKEVKRMLGRIDRVALMGRRGLVLHETRSRLRLARRGA